MREFDWGGAGMRVGVPSTGCATSSSMDVTLTPGKCHDFHKHPDQDEMIIVKSGRVVQWLEEEQPGARPGRLGLHRQGRRPRLVQRVRRDGGAAGDPRARDRRRRLRARRRRRRGALGVAALMQAVRVHEGGELRHETVPDPEPGAGEVIVELRTAALNRRDLLVCEASIRSRCRSCPARTARASVATRAQEVVIYPALAGAIARRRPARTSRSSAGRATGRTPSSSPCPRRTCSRSRRGSPGRRPRHCRSQG